MGRISKIQKTEKHKHCTISALSNIFCSLLILVVFSGCASVGAIKVDANEEIEIEQVQLQESHLLDVGIVVFNAGDVSLEQQENDGVSPEIREAEARYISYHLRETIQKTGGWGAVNVLPSESEVVDVIIEGEIIESTGGVLKLKISVADSIGQNWFENTYLTEVTRKDYTQAKDETDLIEIYQGMYNRVANDINAYRKKIDEKQLLSIRNTSELKYAANLAPDIYVDYISQDAGGHTTILRLPATDDPSLLRVQKIREREYLLIDTINEYYGSYYDSVHETYNNWRKYYLIETLEKQKVQRESKVKKALGAAAVVGSILMVVLGENISPALVVGGVALYKDGVNAGEEAVIHEEAIVELSESLKADVEPLVIEVDGEAKKLTGTLDEQYRQWRTLLQAIYQEEIGIPEEVQDENVSDGL